MLVLNAGLCAGAADSIATMFVSLSCACPSLPPSHGPAEGVPVRGLPLPRHAVRRPTWTTTSRSTCLAPCGRPSSSCRSSAPAAPSGSRTCRARPAQSGLPCASPPCRGDLVPQQLPRLTLHLPPPPPRSQARRKARRHQQLRCEQGRRQLLLCQPRPRARERGHPGRPVHAVRLPLFRASLSSLLGLTPSPSLDLRSGLVDTGMTSDFTSWPKLSPTDAAGIWSVARRLPPRHLSRRLADRLRLHVSRPRCTLPGTRSTSSRPSGRRARSSTSRTRPSRGDRRRRRPAPAAQPPFPLARCSRMRFLSTDRLLSAGQPVQLTT